MGFKLNISTVFNRRNLAGWVDKVKIHPVESFFVGAISVGILSYFIYWIFAVINTKDWHPSPSEAMAAPIALALSTAVGFAGAFVAIILAKNALEIQETRRSEEDQQAAFDTLKILSGEVSKFLEPYASVLQEFRRITAIAELHHARLFNPITNSNSRIQEDSERFNVHELDSESTHLILQISQILKSISSDLERLYKVSRSNIFSSVAYNATINREERYLNLYGAAGKRTKLGSLPSICVWLDQRARDLELLASNKSDLYRHWSTARCLASSCGCSNGEDFDHRGVRCLLLIGFLASPIDIRGLKAVNEVRPPLIELIHMISTAFDSDKVSEAFNRAFSFTNSLQMGVNALIKLTPSPIDAELKVLLDDYQMLRPRVSGDIFSRNARDTFAR